MRSKESDEKMTYHQFMAMKFTSTQFNGIATHKYSLESHKRGMSARVRIELLLVVRRLLFMTLFKTMII